MKSLVGLFVALLKDLGEQQGADGVGRDEKSLLSRIEQEGISFLTITLPTFAQALERALETGSVAPWAGLGFGLRRSGIPHLFGGFLRHVFDESGQLLDDPAIGCISAVRQLCRFAKSVNLPCTRVRELAAVKGFVQCDLEVEDAFPEEGDVGLFRTFGLVADAVSRHLELDEAASAVRPTHGPGVVREHLTPNQRWARLPYWPTRLADAGLTARMAYLGHELPLFGVEFADEDWVPPPRLPGDEPPVKVALVPKTLAKPRVIAVEPAAMQFAQQGASRWFKGVLERSPLTRGHVNFRDQSINQNLALTASQDGRMATLDLSDASDRVGLQHVRRALQACPDTLRLFEACRSERAELPFGLGTVTLRKFASMGSALTFPVEAYIFFLSIIAIRLELRSWQVHRTSIARVAKDVYVYGDDLVVPADEAPAIVAGLEALGFRVNHRKCFWDGQFRESCGMDAFRGVEVTPVYLRRLAPSDRTDVSGILSAVATANQLHSRGWYRARDLLKEQVEAVIGKLPGPVSEESPAVGWIWESNAQPPKRWNDALQRWEHRCWVAEAPRKADPLEGVGALAKCFRPAGERGEPNLKEIFGWKFVLSRWEDHLGTSVRPYVLKLKRRWLYGYNRPAALVVAGGALEQD